MSIYNDSRRFGSDEDREEWEQEAKREARKQESYDKFFEGLWRTYVEEEYEDNE